MFTNQTKSCFYYFWTLFSFPRIAFVSLFGGLRSQKGTKSAPKGTKSSPKSDKNGFMFDTILRRGTQVVPREDFKLL